MTAIGFGVIWAGYTVFLHGWATIKGYRRIDLPDQRRISYGDLLTVPVYTGPWTGIG